MVRQCIKATETATAENLNGGVNKDKSRRILKAGRQLHRNNNITKEEMRRSSKNWRK